MNKPPDQTIHKTSPALKWDKTKTLNFSQPGPIYLMMKRTNSNYTLANVSPFLLKKAIDYTCNGEVEECKKLMSGNILIKTKNYVQASKLTTLTALSESITVEIIEYKTLNQTKGVIYSNDLRGIPENEISNELADQNVCEVKKIKKFINNESTETGLLILTFSSSTLPTEIKIGYQKVNVRPYIPLPIKCNNCQQYGHIGKFCKNKKTCFHCANEFHLDPELDDDECFNEVNCVNCIRSNLPDTKHTSKDKKCPIFIKHKELQAIKTIEKVDNKTAHKIYNERHQNERPLYSAVINSNNTTTSNKQPNLPNPQTKHSFSIPPTQTKTIKPLASNTATLDSITDSDSDIFSQPSTSAAAKGKILKILPKNTSKRLQAKFKANSKSITTSLKAKQQINNNAKDDDKMDL